MQIDQTGPGRIGRWARRALAATRRTTERALHPGRRSRARARLARQGPPRAVLFVCQGNIYRSPYAAGAFAAKLPAPWRGVVRIESGGFVGPNRCSPPDALATALSRGVSLAAHRSSLLTRERVRAMDLVVVMNAMQRQAVCQDFGARTERVLVLGDLDPSPIASREIQDPWRQEPGVLEQSYARVERCVGELVRVLVGGSAAPSASTPVAGREDEETALSS
jgi:protein-tyrosine phosphatase